MHLCKLSPNSTRQRQRRVHIAEKALRVIFNLLDLEVLTIVKASLRIVETSLEGTSEAALAASLVALSGLLGVGEGDAWWATLALERLVDVGGG